MRNAIHLLTCLLSLVTFALATTAVTPIFEEVAKANSEVYTLSTIGGIVYFGLIDGTLRSYSPKTDQQETIGEIPLHQYSSSAVLNNILYIGSNNSALWKYNPSDKILSEVVKADSRVQRVTSLNGKIYFGTSSGSVYEFDPTNQASKVVANVNSSVTGLGAMDKLSKVYIGTLNFELHEFDPATGQVKLLFTSTRQIYAIMGLDDDLYYTNDERLLLRYIPETGDRRVVCFFPGLNDWPRALTTYNGKVYLGLFSPEKLWRFDPSREHDSCVAIADPKDGVFALTTLDNKVYAATGSSVYAYYEL